MSVSSFLLISLVNGFCLIFFDVAMMELQSLQKNKRDVIPLMLRAAMFMQCTLKCRADCEHGLAAMVPYSLDHTLHAEFLFFRVCQFRNTICVQNQNIAGIDIINTLAVICIAEKAEHG